jgi:hypothetical protein
MTTPTASTPTLNQNANRVNAALQAVRYFEIDLCSQTLLDVDYNDASLDLGAPSVVALDLTCSARTGTSPTMDIDLETSPDNSTWAVAESFALVTAAGTQRILCIVDRYIRPSIDLGGTSPVFSFTITGEAK